MAFVDYTGQQRRLITVIKKLGPLPNGQDLYLCKDLFGASCKVSSNSLLKPYFGRGLYNAASIKNRRSLLDTYNGMYGRCHRSNNKDFKNYGARGITICDDWLGKEGREHFFIWAVKAGWKPGLTIDRKNPSKGYAPHNCQVISRRENSRKRRNVFLDLTKARQLRKAFLTHKGDATSFCEKQSPKYKVKPETIRAVLTNRLWKE